jgi:hypothetical protein
VVIEPRTVADNYMGEHAWHPSQFEPHEVKEEAAEEDDDEDEPVVAATIQETTGQEKSGTNEDKPDEDNLNAAIPAELTRKEKQLALLAKTRASILALLAPLAKQELLQKGP